MLKKLFMTAALSVSLFAMHEAELDLNNYDLDAKINFDAGQFNPDVEPDTVFFGFRYLHGSHQHNDRDLSKDHDLVDGHFFVRQRLAKANALTLGMGAKFVYTSIETYDYYAPQVLSWDDAKNYFEYDIHLDVMLIDRAGLSAGYRKINTDFEMTRGDLTFNETWFVGVKFRF